jgi:hypothetical protein
MLYMKIFYYNFSAQIPLILRGIFIDVLCFLFFLHLKEGNMARQ